MLGDWATVLGLGLLAPSFEWLGDDDFGDA
jgi:hypothetical protein